MLLTWQQEDLQRRYIYDRLAPGKSQVLKEEHLDATTVGNFAPFLTHSLRIESESASEVAFDLVLCEDNPKACEPKGLTTLSGQPTIRDLPENYPLYFIKTDKDVMNGHNDIFNDKIRAFLLTMINDVVRRDGTAKAGDRSPSILRSADQLKKEAGLMYEEIRGASKKNEAGSMGPARKSQTCQ